MKQRVALGLSGGVDSAVAAALLVAQGYEVVGVFMVCYQGLGCRSDQDRQDALDVALKLKIPFEVIDFRQAYQEKVLANFKAEYEAGRTPNPDVLCNREIKFGLFYEEMINQRGFDYVATGHYARIRKFGTQSLEAKVSTQKSEHKHQLLRGEDERKDQTYFLYQLRAGQLEHVLFPVGGLTKGRVRQKARALDLAVADKPDSQGICFVGEVGIREFLKKLGLREERGEVVNRRGEVIGEHRGVGFYTIGQRHGFYIKNLSSAARPVYVIGKDAVNNRLIVGMRGECMRREFEVEEVHFIRTDLGFMTSLPDGQVQDLKKVTVRIRHGGELVGAKGEKREKNLRVLLAKPVFGVAAGQSAVFYDNDVCLGGGVIV